jgi:hypothetical protein
MLIWDLHKHITERRERIQFFEQNTVYTKKFLEFYFINLKIRLFLSLTY